jgi:hypothetical protein
MEYLYIAIFGVIPMEYVNLESVLQPGMEYVADYFSKQGKEISVVKHEVVTNTCFEKADSLQWDYGDIVKSVFLWGKQGKFYAFVSPEIGTRDRPLKFDNQLIKKIFREDKKGSKQMMNLKNSISPLGMDYGTCGPFVPDYFFNGDGFTGSLDKIFIYDSSDSNKKVVDISMGGYGEEAYKISAQLFYEDLVECLECKFGEKIERFKY